METQGMAAASTVLVTMDPPTAKEGVILPTSLYWHCSVLVDETVYLLGGYGNDQDILAVSIIDGSFIFKTNMIHGRYQHACASFTGSDGKVKIAVAGGSVSENQQSATDIYSIDNDSWSTGKFICKLKKLCTESPIVYERKGNNYETEHFRTHVGNVFERQYLFEKL